MASALIRISIVINGWSLTAQMCSWQPADARIYFGTADNRHAHHANMHGNCRPSRMRCRPALNFFQAALFFQCQCTAKENLRHAVLSMTLTAKENLFRSGYFSVQGILYPGYILSEADSVK